MSLLRITHNAEDGTVLRGEQAHSAAVDTIMNPFQAQGWRPNGVDGCWFNRKSAGLQPNMSRINPVDAALKAGGFEVKQEFDRTGCRGEPS